MIGGLAAGVRRCVCAHCTGSDQGSCRDATGAAVQQLCGEHGHCSAATGRCVCSGGFSGAYCTTPDPQGMCGAAQWPARLQRVQQACPVGAAHDQPGAAHDQPGHRRMQHPGTCGNVNSRMSLLNDECCNQATEDCSTGLPSTCNANCARPCNAGAALPVP